MPLPHGSAAESGRGLPSRQFVCLLLLFLLHWTPIKSYRSFQDADNRDERLLRKTELKLYEVVTDILFTLLFYCILPPKALLSLESSSLFFRPWEKYSNQQLLVCMKTA